jgi:hypothetical protein
MMRWINGEEEWPGLFPGWLSVDAVFCMVVGYKSGLKAFERME